jgi:mRNA interferase RelE/StbE
VEAYTVEVAPAAGRALRKLERVVQQRILVALDKLTQQPRPHDAIKLEGPEGFYRIRVGDFRIIYQVHDGRLLVLVVTIGNRRDVYKSR